MIPLNIPGSPNGLATANILNPISVLGLPNIFAQSQAQLAQIGTLKPDIRVISIPSSGNYSPLFGSSTIVSAAQILNNSSVTIYLSTQSNGQPSFPISSGLPFTFGPIDLSLVYASSAGPSVNIPIYMEHQ